MSDYTPTIGRTVLYTLNQHNVTQITKRRKAALRQLSQHGEDGCFQLHLGNDVRAGQQYPMVIVHVWGDGGPNSSVNGQVQLDGSDTLWVKSISCGEGEGKYQWPTRS
jgi:hypothetical protein